MLGVVLIECPMYTCYAECRYAECRGAPPCTNSFRSAHFYIENIIYLCYKTSYLNEEVNCTEALPSVSVPWRMLKKTEFFYQTSGVH